MKPPRFRISAILALITMIAICVAWYVDRQPVSLERQIIGKWSRENTESTLTLEFLPDKSVLIQYSGSEGEVRGDGEYLIDEQLQRVTLKIRELRIDDDDAIQPFPNPEHYSAAVDTRGRLLLVKEDDEVFYHIVDSSTFWRIP